MLKTNKILAKTENQEDLISHSVKGKIVLDILEELGIFDSIIQAFKLEWTAGYLALTSKIAILCHDIGKANSHMQATLGNETDRSSRTKHIVRHEIVSILFLLINKLALTHPSYDFKAVVLAVLNHHLKSRHEVRTEPTEEDMVLYFDHPYMHKFVQCVCRQINIIPNLDQVKKYKQLSKSDWDKFVYKTIPNLAQPNNTAYSITRALVIFADSIASCKLTAPKQKEWVRLALKTNTLTPQDLNRITQYKLAGKPLYKHQEDVCNVKTRVTIAECGTGSGKTITALQWAKSQGIPKLFFLLPQRSLATSMFQELDLLNQLAGGKSGLVHSTADLDMERILSNQDDDKDDEDKTLFLQGLDLIQTGFVCATAHTLLGFLQNNRMGTIAIPAIAMGGFVFDEAHAGGGELFQHILKFIATVNRPVLIMSATLTDEQKADICKAANGDVTFVKGDSTREQTPRYRLHFVENKDLEQLAINHANQGKKVLWVCNTVSKTQSLYCAIAPEFTNTHINHSRFTPDDRVVKTSRMIEAFRADSPVIAIASQVAEMSLDISANTLFTEECPFWAFIQRIGRAGRYGGIADIYIYDGNHIPYKQEDVANWIQAIKHLDGQVVSQADLAAIALTIPNPQEQDDITYGFIDESGSVTTTKRAIANYNSVSVVPDKFLSQVSEINNKNLRRYAIAVPAHNKLFTQLGKTYFYHAHYKSRGKVVEMAYDNQIGLIQEDKDFDAIII